MATAGPQQGSALFSPQMLQLLQNAIGGTVDQNTNQVGNTTNNTNQTNNSNTATTGTQNTNSTGTQNSNTTGSNTSNTTGTNTSNTTGGSVTNTTGGVNSTNQSSTQSTADIAALQQVFQQQQAGITPEMLAAIFSEGSKAAPGLVTATANAVGARSANNTPLATALGNLSAQLTNQAATLSMNQRNASAQTAEAIARLTAGSTTTGSTTQTNNSVSNQTNNSSTTGTNTNNTVGTNVSNTSGTTTNNQVGNTTGNTNQTGNTVTNADGTTSQTGNNQTDTQPNYGNVTRLLGMLLGGNALNQGLSGVGGIGGAIGSATGGIADLIRQLTGGGGGGSGGGLTVDTEGAGTPANPVGGTDLIRQLEQLIAGGGTAQAGGGSGLVGGGAPGFNLGADNDMFSNWLNSLGMGGVGGNTGGVDLGLLGLPADAALPGQFQFPDWWAQEGWDNFDWTGGGATTFPLDDSGED